METTVTLQPWMSFSPWVLAVGIIGVLLFLALLILSVVLLVRKKKDASTIALPNARQARSIRNRYEDELQAIKSQLAANTAKPRECCEAASICVRKFATEMTGGQYNAMTLKEIEKHSGTQGLATAIEECYGTEFPEHPKTSAEKAIDECIKVVRSWS